MLFNESKEFKDFLPISKAFVPDAWKYAVVQIEDEYIQKILGIDQLEELQNAYTASLHPTLTSMPAELIALLKEVRKVIAPLAFHRIVNLTNVQISEAGLRTATSADSEQARQWMVYDLKDELLRMGMAAIENLYRFLEANSSDYSLWIASEAYTTYKRMLVRNATVFNTHVNIQESRWIFLKLIQTLEALELLHIKATIGADYYLYLLDALEADSLTDDDNVVLKLLQKALCNLAISRGISEMTLTYSNGSITVPTQDGSEISRGKQADISQLEKLVRDKEQQGLQFLTMAKRHLDSNASSYPIYAGSDAYTTLSSTDSYKSMNGRRKVFRF